MARTTCGKCGNTRFELTEFVPDTSRFKFLSVQCTSCGVPIGVLDYDNTGHGIHVLKEQVAKIQEDTRILKDELVAIRQKLR